MSFTRQAFTFRCDSSGAWSSGGNEIDELCDECEKLDLEQSFARAFALYEGARKGRNDRTLKAYRSDHGPAYLAPFHYVTSLGDRLSSTTHCKLCTFLRQTTADPSRGTYKLLAFCSSESYLFEPPKKDIPGRSAKRPWGEFEHNVFMAVVPVVPLIPKIGIPLRWLETELPKSGPIYRLTARNSDETRVSLPRKLQPRADLDPVTLWLDLCRDTHECCAPRKPAGASLPGFRAINCTETPPVVEERPWSGRYVALSYVWGPPSGDWPQTILDAVEITKRLGEQYLWVDRLCINQSNLQEKQALISKMDAIYEGAEFTIVAAAGDARTGLPGVAATLRTPQPSVELQERSRTTEGAPLKILSALALVPWKVLGITKEEFETEKDRGWFDEYRSGLRSMTTLDFSELEKEEEIMKTYDISREHLKLFQNFADDLGNSIDEQMVIQKQLAQRKGIPLRALVPYLMREAAIRQGVPADAATNIRLEPRPITEPSKIDKPLPAGLVAGRTTLISTLEDPRITISNSEWATRGWTYQEGVLSNRRLVFTGQQVYWECRGMAMNESLDIPVLDLCDPSGTRMADYMLSGIFDGDLYRVPELQYGFQTSAVVDDVSEQVPKLNSHIRAFTSRNLSHDSDSLNAFLGIAARYSGTNGLCLLLGMPVWAGLFAKGKPGLQDTFALSVSSWTHAGKQIGKAADIYLADCPRRAQFPSWTWAGWKGRADFCTGITTGESTLAGHGGLKAMVRDASSDTTHVDFFTAMTSEKWVTSINHLWSAEILLHSTDNSTAIIVTGRASLAGTADPRKLWLLTIREPLVLRHMDLMPSTIKGEWRRLIGKEVQIHMSVPVKRSELTFGHQCGDFVTVLVFASMVPFIFNGTARYLILQRVNDAGTRWKRIGRLVMKIEESDMNKYKSTEGMIAGLPVKKFGRDLVLV